MIRWLALALCAALACGRLHAETLNLDQAVARALVHDPRIEEVRHLSEAASTLVQEAEGHRGWIFDINTFLGLSAAADDGMFEGGACTPGNCRLRNDRYDLDNGVSLWTNLQFSLIKPLYTFGKIEHYAEAARANVRIKTADIQLQRGATMLDVKRAYYGYLAARDTRLLMEDVKERMERAVNLTQQWLDSGEVEAKQSDLYALQAGAALAGRYRAEANALENIAMEGLKVLTGVGRGNTLELADTRLNPAVLPDMDLPALQAKALSRRPEMEQVEAGLRARRELVEANKSNKKPDIYAGLVGAVSYSPGRNHLDNPYISDPFNDYGATPLVGIKWNWMGDVQSARVARSQAELNATLAKSTLAREGIPFQVAEQFYQVQGNYEAVQQLAEGSRAARRWLISGFADFEAGLEKADTVLAAFQGYVLAQTEYVKMVFNYNMHLAQLLNVTGADSQ